MCRRRIAQPPRTQYEKGVAVMPLGVNSRTFLYGIRTVCPPPAQASWPPMHRVIFLTKSKTQATFSIIRFGSVIAIFAERCRKRFANFVPPFP